MSTNFNSLTANPSPQPAQLSIVSSVIASNGSFMASLLIACGACLFERASAKKRAKTERDAEYAANFEALKAENARRVRGISIHGADDPALQSSNMPGTGPEMAQQPPSYDDVAPNGYSDHTQSSNAAQVGQQEGLSNASQPRSGRTATK